MNSSSKICVKEWGCGVASISRVPGAPPACLIYPTPEGRSRGEDGRASGLRRSASSANRSLGAGHDDGLVGDGVGVTQEALDFGSFGRPQVFDPAIADRLKQQLRFDGVRRAPGPAQGDVEQDPI